MLAVLEFECQYYVVNEIFDAIYLWVHGSASLRLESLETAEDSERLGVLWTKAK